LVPTEEHLADTLFLGYGNADRQDDGVAWHILNRLATRLGLPATAVPEDGLELLDQAQADFLFVLQLAPDLAEIIANYPRVCFVDAHTGALPDDLHIEIPTAEYQRSPFTHHMTAGTCLSLAQTLYGKVPQAILLSVRGYFFNFSVELSPQTNLLADQAVEILEKWLSENALPNQFPRI
jgi:hydrogenase maturation protease